MSAYVVAACIAAVPASLTAYTSFQVMRRTRTNHGKTIGQHVESQGEKVDALLAWATGMTDWAEHHTQQDAQQMADVRIAVGLPARPYVTRPLERPALSES